MPAESLAMVDEALHHGVPYIDGPQREYLWSTE